MLIKELCLNVFVCLNMFIIKILTSRLDRISPYTGAAYDMLNNIIISRWAQATNSSLVNCTNRGRQPYRRG